MRRVVVTGIGAVTPIGNNIEEYWNGLINGKLGIDFITKCDTTDLKVKVAGELKGFDPLLYMEKSAVRKTDPYTQYAIAAASQAMEDSGLKDYNPEEVGVYFGSGIGGIQTCLKETEKFRESGPRMVSPFLIRKSRPWSTSVLPSYEKRRSFASKTMSDPSLLWVICSWIAC